MFYLGYLFSLTESSFMQNRKRKLFNPFPKYLQLREILRKRMLKDYQVGDRLPSEQALCDEFRVSRETVREALREFENQGLIERHRAQGTFLVRRPEGGLDERLTGLTEDFSALSLDTHAKVLLAQAIPAPQEASLFAPPGEEIFCIRRLRYFGGVPLALHDAYLPVDMGQKLARLDLSRTSIMRELDETLAIAYFEERELIEAALANDDLAAQLQTDRGAALLLLTRFFVDREGEPLVLFRSYYRSDRYYYTLNLGDRRVRRAANTRQL